jgi:hypothetical protein
MQNGMVFFSNPFKYNCFQKIKVQWLDLASLCGMFSLDWLRTVHHDIMEKCKPCLNSTSRN